MNILYIGDPNSIHDIKWMSWFSEQKKNNCSLLARDSHLPAKKIKNIKLLGGISDYSIFKPWKNKKSKTLIQDAIKNNKIDLVHIFYAEPNLLWTKVINTPIILTTRGSDILVGLNKFSNHKNLKYKIITNQYRIALEKCSSIISTSQKQIDVLNQLCTLNCDVQIIRTGINVSHIKAPKQHKNTIFFPRNMHPLYNHELALKAISKLPIEVQKKYEFVFVNKNSANSQYVNKIQKLIDNLTDLNIRFENSLNTTDYFELLSSSELVIMTPNSDGSPVSGMEALAAQSKLILPKLGYDKDLFEMANFYKPNNLDSLTSIILTTLSSNQKIREDSYINKVDRNIEMTKVGILYKKIIT